MADNTRGKNYECPLKLYKYLDVDGISATLENRTIKLTKPSEFNDPFDINPQSVISIDEDKFYDDARNSFWDLLQNADPSSFKGIGLGEIAAELQETIKGKSRQQRRWYIRKLKKKTLERMDRSRLDFRKNMADSLSTIQDHFGNYGVFCSTIDANNLLMWSHYAEEHSGVVLEFTPSIKKNSALLESKPIIYSDHRPFLYESSKAFVGVVVTQDEAARNDDFARDIVYTKNTNWCYEHEYRLAIPNEIPAGETSALQRFHPEEATTLYLGCRMKADNRDRVIGLALKANPDIEIMDMQTSPHKFELIASPAIKT